jgi:PKD repeat protein
MLRNKMSKKYYLGLLVFVLFITQIAKTQTSIYSPKENYVLAENTIAFKWNPIENALTYEILISDTVDFSNIFHSETGILTLTFEYDFMDAGDYFVKVRGFDGSTYTDWSQPVHFYKYDLFSVNNAHVFQLNADSINETAGVIDTLYNLFSADYYAYQTNVNLKPTVVNNLINNHDGIRFDGNDYMLGTGLTGEFEAYSFFAVVHPYEFVNFRWIFQNSPLGVSASFSLTAISGPAYRFWGNGGSSSGATNFTNAVNTSEFALLSVVTNNALATNKTQLFSNGIPAGTINTNTTTHSNPGYKIGAYNSGTNEFNGDIAELIFYHEAVSDSVRFLIENYLRYKYFPDDYVKPVNLGSDISMASFCDTSINAYQPYYADYLWSTGQTDSLIHISTPGTYAVTVNDIYGNTYTDSINVTYPPYNMLSDTQICLGDSIEWYPTLNSSFSFNWSDGTSDTLLNILTAGNYWFSVTDLFGCTFISDTAHIVIDSFPVIDVFPDNIDHCSGANLSYTIPAGAVNFNWSTGCEDSICPISSAGQLSIIIENENTCQLFDTTLINIVGDAPLADFIYDTVCFGNATHFTDNSSVILPETINVWSWDFGDGEISDIQNPNHQFPTLDTVTVCLNVETDNCTNFVCKEVFAKPKPVADFTIENGSTQCTGIDIQFNNNSTASVNSFYWDFGDGTFSMDENPTKSYESAGDFVIKLQVTNANQCTDSIEKTISIVSAFDDVIPVETVNPLNGFMFFSANEPIDFSWDSHESLNAYLFEIAEDSLFDNILFSTQTENINYTHSIADTGTYFWRTQVIDLCNDSHPSSISNFVISELDTSACTFWMNASANNGVFNDTVRYIINQANGDTIFQNIINKRPIQIIDSAINHQNAFYFDGINDNILFENTLLSSAIIVSNSKYEAELFPDFKGLLNRANTNQPIYLFLGQDGSNALYNGGGNTFGDNVFVNKIQTLNYSPLKQYKALYGFTPEAVLFDELQIGGSINSSARFWHGSIAEIIIYDTVLNETETELVHQYLRHKYAPPVNLGYDIDVPYGFCDTTITTADKPWFTDYLWSTGDTTPTISTNYNGEYSVTVTDIFGFTSTDDIRVNFPRVYQTDALSMVCDGDTLVWDTGIPAEGYNFNWLNSGSTEPYAGYWQNQQAAVQITDTNGCSFFTDTVDIMLDMFEHTAALGDGDTALCVGNRLTLANGAEEAVDFLWQDGSTEPEFLIETAGTYHVTVTNALGCTARDTITVSILGTVPEPDFTVNGECAEASIQLNDASSSADGTITSWEWSYNNEIFATGENSSISFDNMGTYDIQLEVFTDVGCHHTITQSIQIFPLPEPAFSPLIACSDQPVIFENLSSIPQGNMQSSEWQFGSGNEWISADMQAVNHEFTNTGTQAISLSVTSEAGCEKQITVPVDVRQSPQAAFSTSPRCDGEPVYFWNQTDALGTQLWEYHWNFGDGNMSTASGPQHLYPATGNYTLDMSVKSLNGCTDTASMTITVYSLPQAAVDGLDACVGVEHQLTDITDASAGAIVAREWQVAGFQLTGENPTIRLDSLGTYPLSLHVTSETGCTSQIDTLLMVRENPDANFELPQTWGAVPLNLTLENTSLGGEAWIWQFGDGEISTSENPEHVWQDSGNYEIQLIAVSSYGCTDSISKNLRVIIPLIDVGIIALQTSMEDNYLQVSADIINPGTVPITDLALELDPGNGEITREILPDVFAEGAVMRYKFNSQPYFASGKLPEYVCVSLDPGVPDDAPENNRLCNLHDAGFSLQAMYPNPVNDLLNLHILLPRDGKLQLQVFDAAGQRVKSLSLDLNNGYHALALDCAAMSSGRYQLRLSFEEEEIVKTIVIQ